LLPVLTLAQKWDLTADEVARNVFAHPTLSEAVKEAVEGIVGHMINSLTWWVSRPHRSCRMPGAAPSGGAKRTDCG
jgi:hypothetical protein